jgi:serine-threonine kinase receptor-associated protein
LRRLHLAVLRILCCMFFLMFQLTHDGRWLTTTDKNTVRIWDTATLDKPCKEFTVKYPVEAASYCPAKNKFAAGGDDMWVHLHNAETGSELEVNKGHHGPVHTVR